MSNLMTVKFDPNNYIKGPVNICLNKSVFGKNLSKIEKIVKTFSIPNKTFSKNGILLFALRTHVSKIFILIGSIIVTSMLSS